MVEGFENGVVDDLLEGGEIDKHSGAGMDFASNADFEMVVVTVTINAGAFAVDFIVLGLGQMGKCKAVGCTEVAFNGESGFHSVSFVVCPEFGVFK